MIRPATEDDLFLILPMCRKFFEASEYGDVTKFDDESMLRTLDRLIGSDEACLFVSDDLQGMVAGIVYPFYFANEICAQELFWWSEGGHGKELLCAFEEWAKEKGASVVTMICLDRLGKERVEKIYTKAGYRASEHSWIKRVGYGN